MKNIIVFTLLVLGSTASAAGDVDATFDRLKTNVDNASANLADYQKNAPVVQSNLNEVVKARTSAETERKDISANLKDTKSTLGKIEGQQGDLNKLINKEKDQITAEDKKMHDLEAMIEKIKDNKTKREANIQNYQQQLSSMEGDHKNWQGRTDQLKSQETTADGRVKQLKTVEAQWVSKKKNNDNEVYHWQREVERQRKSLSQYQSLADSK